MGILRRKLCAMLVFSLMAQNISVIANTNLSYKAVNLSNRKVEYKDITKIIVYKQEGQKVVEKDQLPTSLNVDEYLVKVSMKDLPDFYATIKDSRVESDRLYLNLNSPNGELLEVQYGKVQGNSATSNGEITIVDNGFLDSLSSLNGYNSNRSVAYENIYQLIPFYSGDNIIEYGNKLDSNSTFVTTKIKTVLPLDENGDLVTYLTKENPDRVKSLKVIFEDGQVEGYNVTYNSSKGLITDYSIDELSIGYNFDKHLISENHSAVTSLVKHIKSVDYDTYLGLMSGNVTDVRSLRDHYKKLQDNAKEVALNILSHIEQLSPTANGEIYNLLLADTMKLGDADSLMLKVLYTYNYYNRFYDFDINSISVAELILFKGTLFKSSLTLETLVEDMRNSKAEHRGGTQTDTFYNNYLSKHTGKVNLGEFVDYLIELFTEYENPSDWFTSTYSKKGFVKEIKSDRFIYRAYEQLKKRPQYLLPFLTLEDWSFYIISMPGQIMVGSPKAYVKDPLNETDRQTLWKLINDFSEKAFLYTDTIGRFINDDVRVNDLMILCMDKRNIANAEGKWEHQYLEGEVDGNPHKLSEDPFHKDFTEVVGVWIRNNGTAAVGGDETVRWVAYTALHSFDAWSHETGHNIDQRLLMKGRGLRGEMEDYTTGIIEQGNGDGPYQFNVSVGHKITDTISNNFTPERINSPEKVYSYYKGMFEALDLLDYLEAKAFLKLSQQEKESVAYYAYYTQNNATPDDIGFTTYFLYPLNVKFPFQNPPYQVANPTTMEELYDTRVILRPGTRPSKPGGTGEELTITSYVSDNIYSRWWYTPHYSEGKGRGDSRTFKVMGFRMLAEAGYDNGFVRYLSYGSHTDLDGIRKITGKDSFKDWRLDKFKQIESKLNQLAYINAEELEAEFLEALKLDASNNDRDVTYSTKVRQRNYYLLKRMTEDFVQSIYDQEQKVVPISTIEDLQMLIDVPNGNYELVNDINVSSATGKAVVDGIFVGKLNGNGYKIHGSQLPLFTEVRHAFIENLLVENAGNGVAIKDTNSKLKNVEMPIEYIPVSTVEQFLNIKDNLSGNYKLTADIDFSEYKPTTNASVIKENFTGVIEGDGFTIQNLNGASLFNNFEGTASNLHIKNFTNRASGSEYVSAFAKQMNNAKLSDITFDNIEIVGRQYTGVVAGKDNSNSSFERISIKNANVIAKNGFYNSIFIGRKYGGRISDVYLDGTLEVSTTENGGLLGAAHDNVQMNRIVSRVDLQMGTNTDGQKRKQNGGIIGNIYSPSTLKNSVYLGTVTGDTYSLTGSTTKNQFSQVYEYNGTGGILSADNKGIQSIGLDGLTEELYKKIGFDDSIWSFHTIDSGYPVLLTNLEICSSPVISPEGGVFKDKKMVEITTDTPDATIYYTTDGTTPTKNSNVYTTPIEIVDTTTIKAIAVKDGMAQSSVVEVTFTKQAKHPTPTAKIDFINEKLINITTGASITIDGNPYTSDDGSIPIKEQWMNDNDVSIIHVGENNIESSDPQKLNIPSRPNPPTVTAVNESYPGAGDGKILNVDSTMEYYTSKNGRWIPITDDELINLTSGGYYVRYKAVEDDSFASRETVVNVGNDAILLNGITIISPPNKTDYYQGDIFDPSGIEVIASYSDKTEKLTETYAYKPDAPLSKYNNEITIIYEEGGVRVTTTQAISVIPLSIEGYYADENGTPLNTDTEVPYNTSEKDALSSLDNKVYIALNSGKTLLAFIDWSFDDTYYPMTPGIYNVTGTITGNLPSSIIPSTLTGTITLLNEPDNGSDEDNQDQDNKPEEPDNGSDEDNQGQDNKPEEPDSGSDEDNQGQDDKPNRPDSGNGGNNRPNKPNREDENDRTPPTDSNVTTEVITNDDGSKTTIITDKKTGTITETTEYKNGNKTVVETYESGMVITKSNTSNGIKVEVISQPDVDIVAKVSLPTEIKDTNVLIPIKLKGNLVPIDVKTGKPIKLSIVTQEGIIVNLETTTDLILQDNSKYFIDTNRHWAEEAIDFVTAREIFTGTSDNTFNPNEPMTRAMLMTVLSRFDGEESKSDNKWYESGLRWAINKGISDGTNLNGHITREQLATMLYRYVGSPEVTGSIFGFVDTNKVSSYSIDAMTWAVNNGLISGMENRTLNPQGKATRAQVATIIMRFCELLLTSDN